MVGVAGLSLLACSSIVQGTFQDIVINTNPADATCILEREGIQIAKIDGTPTSVNVKKTKHDITISCSKDGYQTATYINKSGWESASGGAGIALDVFLTLGLSSAIDSATGADNKYTSPVNITLLPVETSDAVNANTSQSTAPSTIEVHADVEQWQDSGVQVVQGQSYKILASGTWTVNAERCGWTGPDGGSGRCSVPLAYPQTLKGSYSALIARIGTGPAFLVGSNTNFTADTSGTLFFRVNDAPGGFHNNEGKVTVQVNLASLP